MCSVIYFLLFCICHLYIIIIRRDNTFVITLPITIKCIKQNIQKLFFLNTFVLHHSILFYCHQYIVISLTLLNGLSMYVLYQKYLKLKMSMIITVNKEKKVLFCFNYWSVNPSTLFFLSTRIDEIQLT